MDTAGLAEARAAAMWALGRIHEAKGIEAPEGADLAKRAEERLNDIKSLPQEDARMRVMSAVTIARLKAKDALPSLRMHFRDRKPSLDPVNNACGWAIEQLTGETMPPVETIRLYLRDWFLTPDQ
jgi:hypothetical protein